MDQRSKRAGPTLVSPSARISSASSRSEIENAAVFAPGLAVPDQRSGKSDSSFDLDPSWTLREERNNLNTRTMTPSIAEYPLIVLFTTIGASFLISSRDLVSMYLSIELQSFAVYILAAIYRNSESATSAGLKYFLLGALSSALILLGSSLIYAYTGLTNFEMIYSLASVGDSVVIPITKTRGLSMAGLETGVVLGVLIIGVGFLFKVAAAPFHS